MVNSPTLPTSPKLRRRNAIRYKNKTEPRITRSSLSRSIQTGSQSQPTTPARVNMDRCQNLEDQLRIRKPLAPEAVDLQQVQDLTYALPDVPQNIQRRSLRPKPRVDYLKLHLGED